MVPRNKQPKKPAPDSDNDRLSEEEHRHDREIDDRQKDLDEQDGRTELGVSYRGAKGTIKIGRSGSMLLWAIAWAVAVLSTLIGLTMLANLLDKIGVIGCMFSITIFLASQVSAFWPR